MAGPSPPVAEVRVAVRRALAALVDEGWTPADSGRPAAGPLTAAPGPPAAAPGPLVLVACSGGADSLALASALAVEAPRAGFRAGLVTVDHRLQDGSTARAERVCAWGARAGLDPVEVLTVRVAGPGGPEGAARTARYAALDAAAAVSGAVAVLLGHTREDQAETVLLGLARGSGPRAVTGMPARRGVYRRPLLGVARATTRAACAAEGLDPWEDPHNTDPAFARARVRALLPGIEEALGSGAIAALARTARLVRVDTDLLDALGRQVASTVLGPDGLDAVALSHHHEAVRTRVLHSWAVGLGVPAGAVQATHVQALDALVVAWRGQGPVHLPGAVLVERSGGRLRRVPSGAR